MSILNFGANMMRLLAFIKIFLLRALITTVIVLISGLFLISAVFNLRPSLLFGSSDPGPYTELGIGKSLPGSVTAPLSTSQNSNIAITFDDGVDPIYTPKILDVLNRYNAKATFFVIGEHIPGNEKILQEMTKYGHELGVHSFTHDRMGDLSDAHNLRQHTVTQKYLLGATGTKPYLARPPYSSRVEDLPQKEYEAAKLLQESGFTMVFSDIGPPDYDESYSNEKIAELSMPENDQSAILTLHDGGGKSRQRTVDALEILLPRLINNGYQFQTISEYAGLPSPAQAPTIKEQLLAKTVLWVAIPYRIFERAFIPILFFVSALLVFRFIVSIFFALSMRWKEKRRKYPADFYPSVTVIVPAYNEEIGIVDALHSIKNTSYQGPLEILVIDDGSTDETRLMALTVSEVTVITKENGGKASALNLGIQEARNDICVLIDGDTVFTKETIPQLVKPFSDPKVGAVSGNPKVGNHAVNALTKIQHLEYLVGCSLDRRMQTELSIISCIPGAVGAYRKSILEELGGLDSSTLAEDTDLTIRVGSAGWKIACAMDALAFTEAPATLKSLWKQRIRWSYGVMQTIRKNWSKTPMTANNRYRISVVQYLFFLNVLVALLAPLADILTLFYILEGQASQVVKAYVIVVIIQILATVLAAFLDQEKNKYLYLTLFQAIFYRVFNFFVTVTAIRSVLSGKREAWNKPKRVGLRTKNTEELLLQ